MSSEFQDPRAEGRGARWFAVAVTAAYLGVALAGILRHEPWRDELQAWMVVTDADSLGDVFRNMRYEGNPMLWQLFLFGLSRVTLDPRIMQFFHVGIAAAFVWVFARHAPFPRLLRILFPFGYFALFEYGLISRGYGLGLLLALIACTLYPRRTGRYPWIGAVLFLLANTSLYGMVIAGGLLALLVLDFLENRSREPYAGRGGGLAAGAAIAVGGIGLSVLQIWPEADNTFFVPWPERLFEPARFGFVASKIFASYVPVPELGNPHWWNTNAFVGDAGLLTWLLPLLAVGAGSVVFLGKPRVFFLYVSGNAVLLFLFYLTLLASARYYGHFFILLVICSWIAAYEPDHRYRLAPLERVAGLGRAAGGPLLAVVLVANVVGGAVAYGRDLTEKFTVTGDVAASIQFGPWGYLPVVGATDFQTSPLAALLRRELYYPEQREFGSFLIWDADRKDLIDMDDVAAAVRDVLALRGGDRCLLVLSFQPAEERGGMRVPLDRGMLAPGVRVERLESFPPGIVADETYHLYLADLLEEPGGAVPPLPSAAAGTVP